MRIPEENLSRIQAQLKDIQNYLNLIDFLKIKITCPDCKRKVTLLNMYRCYCCGLYICNKCCLSHFNIKKPKRLQTLKGDK